MIDLDATFGKELLEIADDNPNRRYQRTDDRISSAGNWKPANVADPV